MSGAVNGSRMVVQDTYQFSFTPLSGETVTGTAQIESAAVRNLSAGEATVNVCGNVKTNGDPTAARTLDSTGSMSWNDPDDRRRQAGHAFAKRRRKEEMGAVLSFDATTGPSEGLRAAYLWQNFTGNQGLLTAAVNHATFVGGNTPLDDAILDVSDLLRATGKTNTRILSAEAGGCLELQFTRTPVAGTVLTGELVVTLKEDGKKSSTVVSPFRVTVQ